MAKKVKKNAAERFTKVKIDEHGLIDYYNARDGMKTAASLSLLIIHEAWDRGCDFEEEADGFGKGIGTHGDWSAIRDSSDNAKSKMLQKALNFLFE